MSAPSTTRAQPLIQRAWFDPTLAALIAFTLSLPVLGYPLRNLSAPWGSGDLLAHYVNADAWAPLGFPVSTHYGAPYGMDLAYMPTIDWTQNAFAWVVQLLTGSPFTGLNLLLVLSFPITAALAVIAFRFIGSSGPIPIALAVSFTFVPYHLDRGLSHLYPATMYAGVTGIILALLIGTNQLPSMRPSLPRLLAITALVIVSAWSGMYYASFAIIFTSTAVLWRWIRGDGLQRIAQLALIPFSIAVLTILAFLPGAIRLLTEPPIVNLVARDASDSIVFAGNLAQLLTPYPSADLPLVSRLASTVTGSQELMGTPSESAIAGFGTLVTSAALITSLVGWAVIARRRLPSPLPVIALLTSVGLFFFVPWGGGYLFASLITPQLRAWGRLTPVLLLLLLVGAAAVLARTRIALRPWRSTLGWVIAATATAITLTVQILPFRATYTDAVDQGRFVQGEVIDYSRAVNSAIPERCAVLQLPYMAFPENGVRKPGLNDYEHAWQPLINRGKDFSHGTIKGTEESLFTASMTDPPSRSQLDQLRQTGFCAVHVDRRGYTDVAWQRVTSTFDADLGKPTAEGLDGAWLFYQL